jgi:arginine N-succinyltransferase
MFIIRRAKLDDMATLLKLAKMVHFINLPPDKDVISTKIVHSQKSFQRTAWGEPAPQWKPSTATGGLAEAVSRSDLYMFVLEDTDSPGVLGTSQLITQMGGPGDPNWCFKLEKRDRFSKSLKSGSSFIVAKLFADESGPTEIGGLILQPSFRNHPAKLGRFIALIRFHFMGLYRDRFRDEILSEMMAPITPDGNNLLWDCLGRRFIPLSYTEADRFCQHSREFIPALMPVGDLYLSLLPPEARNVVGEVGPETVPARRMLEKLGFEYRNLVDPFDGGPFLHAKTDSIEIVKATGRAEYDPEPIGRNEANAFGFVSVLDSDGEFRAVQDDFHVAFEGKKARIRLPKPVAQALEADAGDTIGFTPLEWYEEPVREALPKSRGASKGGGKAQGKRTGKVGAAAQATSKAKDEPAGRGKRGK